MPLAPGLGIAAALTHRPLAHECNEAGPRYESADDERGAIMTFNFFSWAATVAHRCARAADALLRAPAPRSFQFGLLVASGPANR